MKFQVSEFSRVNGFIIEECGKWQFDEEADAKAFYDDFDYKPLFSAILCFGRYDDENEVFEVFESQEITIEDLED